MVCPLCGNRRARRGCPAVGTEICAICCGTKRLVEIDCPADCPWLASAREHPPAVLVRQLQRDVAWLDPFARGLSERQSQLFFLIGTFLVTHQPPALQPLIDDDVAEGLAALAATFETASRGVIYEHRPASLPAERMIAELKPVLLDAGGSGSAFERDAAVVLRRIADAARTMPAPPAGHRRGFLDLLRRVLRTAAGEAPSTPEPPPARPPLIVP